MVYDTSWFYEVVNTCRNGRYEATFPTLLCGLETRLTLWLILTGLPWESGIHCTLPWPYIQECDRHYVWHNVEYIKDLALATSVTHRYIISVKTGLGCLEWESSWALGGTGIGYITTGDCWVLFMLFPSSIHIAVQSQCNSLGASDIGSIVSCSTVCLYSQVFKTSFWDMRTQGYTILIPME